MKILSHATLFVGAASLLLMLSACDSEAKLAREITGTWATAPEKLIDHEAMSATAVRMMQFTPSLSDSKSGDMQMTALVSITNAMPGDTTSIIEPYTVSASGLATLNGAWAVVDDDKVILHLDESTLDVTVDPEAVLVSVNTLTDVTTTTVDSIKPSIAVNLKKQITDAVRNQVFNTSKIDDIKLTGNLMSCEINHHDVTLRRQDSIIK